MFIPGLNPSTFQVTAHAPERVAADTVQEELATQIRRGGTRIQQCVHKPGDTDCSYISKGTHYRLSGTPVRAKIEMHES